MAKNLPPPRRAVCVTKAARNHLGRGAFSQCSRAAGVAARKVVEITNEIGRAVKAKRLDIVALPQQLCCSFDGTKIVTGHAGTSL
jgi:hypothetical protein